MCQKWRVRICHWGHPFFGGCTFGGVYIPCIYSHARWSYRRRFRSLLCPLFVERYHFPLFVDSTQVSSNWGWIRRRNPFTSKEVQDLLAHVLRQSLTLLPLQAHAILPVWWTCGLAPIVSYSEIVLFVERDKSTFSARSPGCSLRLCVSQSTFRTKIILLITPVCVSKSTCLSRDQIVHDACMCVQEHVLVQGPVYLLRLCCFKEHFFVQRVTCLQRLCVSKSFFFFLQIPACPLSMYVLKSTFLSQRPACLLRLCVCVKVVLPQISASLYYVCVKEYVGFFPHKDQPVCVARVSQKVRSSTRPAYL